MASDVGLDPEKELLYEDLNLLTNNFGKENFIGRTQYGELYRGRIPQGWKGCEAQDVTVKMWRDEQYFQKNIYHRAYPDDTKDKMIDEIRFVAQPLFENLPTVVKVKGYCFDGNHLGVVYDVNPKNTLQKLLHSASLGWVSRVKTALAVARLVALLHGHEPKYLIRNLASTHIMFDQDNNSILLDFGMILGGTYGDGRCFLRGCHVGYYGYLDKSLLSTGSWDERNDVYGFGVLLFELMIRHGNDRMKKGIREGYFLDRAARSIYKYNVENGTSSEFSLIHCYLRDYPEYDVLDSNQIQDLVLKCTSIRWSERPTMAEVVSRLEELPVVREHIL